METDFYTIVTQVLASVISFIINSIINIPFAFLRDRLGIIG